MEWRREFLQKFPRESWNLLDYLNFGITLLFNSGMQMVMIFFVLSGYFIAMSLDKSHFSFSKKLKMFYTVRAIRIYAPYLASIGLAVLTLYFIKLFSPTLFEISSEREFIKFLGKISYSLYLIHLPVFILFYAILFHYSNKTVFYGYEYLLGVLLSLPAGYFLYKVAEEPSISLIKKVKKLIGERTQKTTILRPIQSFDNGEKI